MHVHVCSGAGCIYFEDEWAVVKNSKLTTYFNPLDGAAANSPIQREKELTPSVFARFALGGALCNAHRCAAAARGRDRRYGRGQR